MKFAGQKSVELVGRGELLVEVGLRALHSRRGDDHLPPQCFLVDEFLENNHFQRAGADPRLEFLGHISAVLLRVRKDGVFFADKVCFSKHHAVDACDRFVAGPLGRERLQRGGCV